MTIKPITEQAKKKRNRTYLWVIGVIVLIEIIVFRSYFFDKIYCFKDVGGDAYNQYYPFQYLSADYIAKHGIPKWSFRVGMGQSLFQFILRDPFDIFLYITGKNYILYLLVYKELVKILLCGITFYFYLKTLKLSSYTAVIGSLLFAFCGYIIVGSVWNDFFFTFPAFNLALLLLSFELLFTKQKWYLFPFAVFLTGISMPLNLYLFGLFLAGYAVLRYVQTQAFNFKKLGSLFLKMAVLGAIGLLLSAPFLIENTLGMLSSPRGTGGFSRADTLSSASVYHLISLSELGICIMRFFSSDILGGQNSPHGWINYFEAPLFYCGLLSLILLPQLFQFLNKRVKIAYGIFLALWLLPIIFPYIRQAFWLFSGDYYRTYAFFVAVIILFYSLQALDFIIQQKKVDRFTLVVTVAGLFLLINYPYFNNYIIDSGIYYFVMDMFLAYGVLLFIIPRQKNMTYIKLFILITVLTEITYLSSVSVNERDAYTFSDLTQKAGYNDYTIDAVNYIKQFDTSFYRIDKNYGSAHDVCFGYPNTLDDGMVEGYNGTSCYNSFNQEYYVNYLELVGAIDKIVESTIRAQGLFPHPVLEAENRVKYILIKMPKLPPNSNEFYDSITQLGDVKILRNKYILPFGYTYSNYMKKSDFNSLSLDQKNYTSTRTCVIEDEDVDKINTLQQYEGNVTPLNWQKDITALKQDTLAISNFDQNHITGNINTDRDKMLYLSIPYDRGWVVTMDGQTTDKFILSGGMTGVFIKAGSHSIELNYKLPFINLGLLMCLLGLIAYVGFWYYTRKRDTDLLNSIN